MKAKNITEVIDFSQTEWKHLINEAIKFKDNPHRKKVALRGQRVGLIFYASSLRTRLSFESATHLLGGSTYFVDLRSVTHEFDGTQRETLEDIIDTLDKMTDVYVLRDYSQKLFEIIKRKQFPPFINGFCKVGHPSQALADLAVVKGRRGTNLNLNYAGVCPSQGSGVMESFVYGVLLLGQQITLITETGKFKGKNKDFQEKVKQLIVTHGGSFSVTSNIKLTVSQADILYVDEWWENTTDFLKRNIGKYKVDQTFLRGSKPTLSILHCLPAHPGREIDLNVMRSQQSLIFEQAEYRVYSAMSLLMYLRKN